MGWAKERHNNSLESIAEQLAGSEPGGPWRGQVASEALRGGNSAPCYVATPPEIFLHSPDGFALLDVQSLATYRRAAGGFE